MAEVISMFSREENNWIDYHRDLINSKDLHGIYTKAGCELSWFSARKILMLVSYLEYGEEAFVLSHNLPFEGALSLGCKILGKDRIVEISHCKVGQKVDERAKNHLYNTMFTEFGNIGKLGVIIKEILVKCEVQEI